MLHDVFWLENVFVDEGFYMIITQILTWQNVRFFETYLDAQIQNLLSYFRDEIQ